MLYNAEHNTVGNPDSKWQTQASFPGQTLRHCVTLFRPHKPSRASGTPRWTGNVLTLSATPFCGERLWGISLMQYAMRKEPYRQMAVPHDATFPQVSWVIVSLGKGLAAHPAAQTGPSFPSCCILAPSNPRHKRRTALAFPCSREQKTGWVCIFTPVPWGSGGGGEQPRSRSLLPSLLQFTGSHRVR